MAKVDELIAAEDLVIGQRELNALADHDLDGRDEALLGTTGQLVLIDPAEGAGIGSWDLRASRLAAASVLRRRPEAYHAQLRAMDEAAAHGDQGEGRTLTSVHDQLLAKESGLSALLVYDDYERRSGLVRVLVDDAEVGDFVGGEWQLETTGSASNDTADAELSRSAAGMAIRKKVELTGGRLDPRLSVTVHVTNTNQARIRGELEVEWNLNLLGGGANPAAYYRSADGESRHDAAGDAEAGATVAFGNHHEGVHVEAEASPPAPARWYPVETVSNSEAGFERVYQGSCLVFRWPVELAAGDSCSVTVRLAVSQAVDRAASSVAG